METRNFVLRVSVFFVAKISRTIVMSYDYKIILIIIRLDMVIISRPEVFILTIDIIEEVHKYKVRQFNPCHISCC